jgi:arsenical pump membrane protein
MLLLSPVQQLAVYSTLAVTLGLVAVRPRVGRTRPLSPALILAGGIAVLIALGVVGWRELAGAGLGVWRALITIASLMIVAEAAHRVGLLGWAASLAEARARSTRGLFVLVFALGAASSAALNNDAAILLVTPLVLALVTRVYPDRSDLAVPFATAVFASAGVAPLLVSNPMNALAADIAGIDFLPYAARMAPVAIVVWLVSLAVLLLLFRRRLDAPMAARRPASAISRPQRRMLAVAAGLLAGYALVGWFSGPVWAVAAAGAAASLLVVERERLRLCREAVSWDTLGFLIGVLVLASGLAQIGTVDVLAAHYEGAGLGTIGVSSALGSAVLNNHPMAVLNVMALDGAPDVHVLAALVGGDLGPRLLPAGSLAGLLWLELLRRHGAPIGLGRFAAIGLALTAPALAASLALLALW